jgi:DNA polymerase-4
LTAATQLDNHIFEEARQLFRKNWRAGAAVRLLGVHASSLEMQPPQIDLLDDERQQRWKQALSAADRLRDKYGESSVSLATGMKGRFRERTHENPTGLPGKNQPKKDVE